MSITGKLLFIASSPHIGCLVHSIRDNQLLIQVEGSFNNSSMFFLSMQRTFIQSMYLTSMSKPMISYTQWDSRVELSQLVIHSISSRTLCSPKPITQPRPKRLLELVTINHMWRHHIICIVELPILDQDPSTIYRVMPISIHLGLDFDHVGTNNAMTHVMVLSAKVRRNERFK